MLLENVLIFPLNLTKYELNTSIISLKCQVVVVSVMFRIYFYDLLAMVNISNVARTMFSIC